MPRGKDTSKHPNRAVYRETPRLSKLVANRDYSKYVGNIRNMSTETMGTIPSLNVSPDTEKAQFMINFYRTNRDSGHRFMTPDTASRVKDQHINALNDAIKGRHQIEGREFGYKHSPEEASELTRKKFIEEQNRK